jgi:hypothetical protein
MDTDGAEHDRVAVGRGARRRFGANVAARTGSILDDNLLSVLLCPSLGEYPLSTSAEPPATNGTIKRIGFDGYCCAAAGNTTKATITDRIFSACRIVLFSFSHRECARIIGSRPSQSDEYSTALHARSHSNRPHYRLLE